jgi:predicted O-methyltransferase YrrM
MLERRAAQVADRLAKEGSRLDDAWQIPPDEAAALHAIVVAGGYQSVLEIGVSYGYSTLHYAHAMRLTGGHVHAVEADARKYEHASRNLNEAGLSDFVTLHLGRAQEVLPMLKARGGIQPFDFVFFDATKAESFEYLDAAWPVLAMRCTIATDNSTTHAKELAPFLDAIRSHPEVIASHGFTIGNGFELSIRHHTAATDAHTSFVIQGPA